MSASFILICLALAAAASAASASASAPVAPQVLYVSSVAKDVSGLRDGTAVRPFATLHDARRAVRSLLSRDRQQPPEAPGAQILVRLSGPFFNASVTFTASDSPARGGRVTWSGNAATHGYGDANGTVLYGGSRITGWTRGALGNPDIWRATLSPDLVDSQGRARFHTLVQDERSAWLARTPNFGSGFLPCSGSNAGFTCASGVLPDSFDCVNSTCSVFTRAGYSSDIRGVISSDPAAHRVTMQSANTDASRGSFYLQGAAELLDEEVSGGRIVDGCTPGHSGCPQQLCRAWASPLSGCKSMCPPAPL